jgi:hypothetical protein
MRSGSGRSGKSSSKSVATASVLKYSYSTVHAARPAGELAPSPSAGLSPLCGYVRSARAAHQIRRCAFRAAAPGARARRIPSISGLYGALVVLIQVSLAHCATGNVGSRAVDTQATSHAIVPCQANTHSVVLGARGAAV